MGWGDKESHKKVRYCVKTLASLILSLDLSQPKKPLTWPSKELARSLELFVTLEWSSSPYTIDSTLVESAAGAAIGTSTKKILI